MSITFQPLDVAGAMDAAGPAAGPGKALPEQAKAFQASMENAQSSITPSNYFALDGAKSATTPAATVKLASFSPSVEPSIDRAASASKSSSASNSVPSSESGGNLMTGLADQMDKKYASLQDQVMNLGAGLNMSDPKSSIKIIEAQTSISNANLEFHYVLQTADNIKHAVSSMMQDR